MLTITATSNGNEVKQIQCSLQNQANMKSIPAMYVQGKQQNGIKQLPISESNQ